MDFTFSSYFSSIFSSSETRKKASNESNFWLFSKEAFIYCVESNCTPFTWNFDGHPPHKPTPHVPPPPSPPPPPCNSSEPSFQKSPSSEPPTTAPSLVESRRISIDPPSFSFTPPSCLHLLNECSPSVLFCLLFSWEFPCDPFTSEPPYRRRMWGKEKGVEALEKNIALIFQSALFIYSYCVVFMCVRQDIIFQMGFCLRTLSKGGGRRVCGKGIEKSDKFLLHKIGAVWCDGQTLIFYDFVSSLFMNFCRLEQQVESVGLKNLCGIEGSKMWQISWKFSKAPEGTLCQKWISRLIIPDVSDIARDNLCRDALLLSLGTINYGWKSSHDNFQVNRSVKMHLPSPPRLGNINRIRSLSMQLMNFNMRCRTWTSSGWGVSAYFTLTNIFLWSRFLRFYFAFLRTQQSLQLW